MPSWNTSSKEPAKRGDPAIPDARVREIFEARYDKALRRTDHMFAYLLLVQWAAAVAFAYWFSPKAWAGRESVVHQHVYAALILGFLITSLPVTLAFLRPGRQSTRYVIACAQMMWSALLIHITGGRIETHFHVFGSLAILAFYRDVKVLVPATVVVAVDHFVRGMYWSESVYGVINPEWWRFLEHAGWVVFINSFLIVNCLRAYQELWDLSAKQAEVEHSQREAVKLERLAAVGQLAASVGHELRNPLAAVRNAQTYIARKLAAQNGELLQSDPRINQFLALMDRELDASAKIIADLLDFSRPREATRTPCPLRPLVDEAISIVPLRDGVACRNEIPDDLPTPDLDKDLFRQVIVNLVQNAAEAIPEGTPGEIVVSAEGGGETPWRIVVADDGPGIPDEVIGRIFEPLFSTKSKGTGLGLAIVSSMVERHDGRMTVDSRQGEGTRFAIELPAQTVTVAQAS